MRMLLGLVVSLLMSGCAKAPASTASTSPTPAAYEDTETRSLARQIEHEHAEIPKHTKLGDELDARYEKQKPENASLASATLARASEERRLALEAVMKEGELEYQLGHYLAGKDKTQAIPHLRFATGAAFDQRPFYKLAVAELRAIETTNSDGSAR